MKVNDSLCRLVINLIIIVCDIESLHRGSMCFIHDLFLVYLNSRYAEFKYLPEFFLPVD